MPFLSSCIKATFIIALAFPLYSETSLGSKTQTRSPPDCKVYADRLHHCTREMDPVCAKNGHTYSNRCQFCSAKLENEGVEFRRYGRC
ncbi:sperm-associated acrosin inhibitor-like [Lemur catta]|uniref:sperm-associated acrosin inhibitor-like n=1 Tax=Lemur catta TaxID=9447 RepID=UPI001E268CED|nr:sperm-associated acrosin inhibitor-like [Lemur catta]XP_045408632.1 sperm-associated acrosin inhibitor-like [Lemur catta]